jgi:hypothetical protein
MRSCVFAAILLAASIISAQPSQLPLDADAQHE